MSGETVRSEGWESVLCLPSPAAPAGRRLAELELLLLLTQVRRHTMQYYATSGLYCITLAVPQSDVAVS